jgi:hypothetical protein
MKINKLYTYKSEQQIWRILLTDFRQFVIETRDPDSREVFFNCIDIETGNTIFKDYQFDEKSWIGIETIYKDVVFFHKYAQPSLPGHKEIICFDIAAQQVLWRSDSLTFQFVSNDQVIAAASTYSGWHFYALNYKTGEVITDYGENASQIQQMRNSADDEKDYSRYKFPEKITKDLIKHLDGDTAIKDIILNLDIIEDVEYTSYEDLFLMNYHHRETGNFLRNKFAAVDLTKNKVIFEEVLNNNAKGYAPDCFFIYENILILLQEKDRIIIYRIE